MIKIENEEYPEIAHRLERYGMIAPLSIVGILSILLIGLSIYYRINGY